MIIPSRKFKLEVNKMKKIFVLIGFILLLGIVFVFSQVPGEIINNELSVSKVIRLTFDAKENKTKSYIYPRWSPSGEKIAFTSNMGFGYGGFDGIWVMNADGTNKKKLVEEASDFIWEPDSKNILFWSKDMLYEVHIETGKIHQVDTSGKKVKSVTMQPSGKIIGLVENALVSIRVDKVRERMKVYELDSSTGQQKVVYTRHLEIWIADADGSNRKMLVEKGSDPLLSPNGRYLSYKDLLTGHSVVIKLEENEEIGLGPLSFNASWSPDNKRIVYSYVRIEEQTREGYGIKSVTEETMDADLYIKNIQSGDSKPLTNTKDEIELYPNWSPDSSMIVYVSGVTGEIYLLILKGDK